MVAKKRVYNYLYESEAREVRSDEYKFVKGYLIFLLIVYLISSIWIFVFIFQQADWERNAHLADARTYAGVTTWTWCTVVTVVIADLLAAFFIYKAVMEENIHLLGALAVSAYVYSIYGLASVYLRGSIVCFVLPFVVATLSVIQLAMQRNEESEHNLSRGLRLRQGPAPTMETFLRDHEAQVAKF